MDKVRRLVGRMFDEVAGGWIVEFECNCGGSCGSWESNLDRDGNVECLGCEQVLELIEYDRLEVNWFIEGYKEWYEKVWKEGVVR